MQNNNSFTKDQLISILSDLESNQYEIILQIKSMLSVMEIKNIKNVKFTDYVKNDELKDYIKKRIECIENSEDKDKLSEELKNFIIEIPFNYLSEEWEDQYSKNLVRTYIKNILSKENKNYYFIKYYISKQ